MAMKKLFSKIESMLDKKQVQIVRLDTEEKMLLSNGDFTPLEASEKALRTLFYKESSLFLSGKQIQTLKEYLEIHPVTDTTVYQTANRIYNDGNLYAYELERETGKCIVMTETEICIGKISHVFFRHSSDYKNQIEPEWKVDVQDIFPLVHKHFNLKNEKQEKLLILYLVTAFWGLRIAHPLLILTGEKGSSKSTTMRKLERLIDPKKSDLCGLPKGSDGLELRLSNTYFVTLDNLSNISRNVSDTIARGLLCDLSRIAYQNGIVSSTLPKTPNHLSKRLSKIKSNLQSEYNITYHIANVGAFKEITIRNNEKVCDSCESENHQ